MRGKSRQMQQSLFRRHTRGDPGCAECRGHGEYPEAHGDGGLLHVVYTNEKSERSGRTRRKRVTWCDECGVTDGL